ncbi:hypothetical protein [Flavobacterium alkalisoli]|uniref:DUF7660 family protein n=1 Tax=Flavobacterium alkalisoli TaxID=2602769 RepID=UPI003A91E099
MEDELYNKQITSRKDFVEFLKLLHKYYTSKPENWENNTLESFLEALSAYAVDIPGAHKNTKQDRNPDIADWQVFADILRGAIAYE